MIKPLCESYGGIWPEMCIVALEDQVYPFRGGKSVGLKEIDLFGALELEILIRMSNLLKFCMRDQSK